MLKPVSNAGLADVYEMAYNARINNELRTTIQENIDAGHTTISVVLVGHSYGGATAVDYANRVSEVIIELGGTPDIHLTLIDGIDSDKSSISRGEAVALQRAPTVALSSFDNYFQTSDRSHNRRSGGIVVISGAPITGATNHDESANIDNWLRRTSTQQSGHQQMDNMLAVPIGRAIIDRVNGLIGP